MSTPSYHYNAVLNWHFDASWNGKPDNPTDAQVIADAIQGFETTAKQQFVGKFPIGHSYSINSITSTASMTNKKAYIPYPVPLGSATITGTTTIDFNTDVPNFNAQMSPDTLSIVIIAIVDAIAIALAVYLFPISLPTVFYLILTLANIAVLLQSASEYNASGGVVGSIGGQGLLGQIIGGVVLLGIAGVVIYALFFTKGGKKVTSKGLEYGEKATRKAYQVARGTYRQARSARTR